MEEYMYKVAVATSDGKNVDTHFGHAEDFTIFTVEDDGSFRETERRKAVPACGGECEADSMEQAAENLKDVEYVLVARIGPNAVKTLARRGITAFDVVMSVGEAINRIHIYRTKTAPKIVQHTCK